MSVSAVSGKGDGKVDGVELLEKILRDAKDSEAVLIIPKHAVLRNKSMYGYHILSIIIHSSRIPFRQQLSSIVFKF